MYRLFCAITLPNLVIEQIKNISFGVQYAKWVPADLMHLTLRFIGQCDVHQFEAVCDSLARVECPDFTVYPEGVGYFPPRGSPRILWVGIAHSDQLWSLRRSIDKALLSASVTAEKAKFHPHITIARLKDHCPPAAIIPFLTGNSLFKTDAVPVRSFQLFSSTLRSEGAQHQCEETYPLVHKESMSVENSY